MMITRFENANDSHKFLRSFIPFYYDKAFKLKEKLPVFQKLGQYRGQIVGDAHVENFGFLIDNKGKARLTMNDFDDTAHGPVFLDVLRLSKSSSYVSNIKQKKLIEAYVEGIQGTKREMSSYITKLAEKAEKGGKKPKVDAVKTKQGLKFAEKNEPNFPVTSEELGSMEKALQEKFGKIKIHDSYRTMKESGGSAFGKRYHAIVDVRGETHFIELKEIKEGGVVSSWVTKPVTEEERVRQGMKAFHQNDFEDHLTVVSLDGKPYQARFKLEGIKSIDLASVKKKDLDQVILDEFYLLGQLHRTSLGNKVKDYIQDLLRVKTKEWEESVSILRDEMDKAYKNSREHVK